MEHYTEKQNKQVTVTLAKFMTDLGYGLISYIWTLMPLAPILFLIAYIFSALCILGRA